MAKSLLFGGNSRGSQVLWNQSTGVKALMLRGGVVYDQVNPAAIVEHIGGGTYNGSGASPTSGVISTGITTDGPNRLIVICCVTSRENTSYDLNEVTAISASGLTFTRIVHDVTYAYSDSAGDPSFPVVAHSIDIFTAPAATQLSNLSWSSTVAGDGFVNHGSVYQFAVAGLASITAPYDPSILTPTITTNLTGSASTPSVTGVSTTHNDNLMLQFIVGHSAGGGPATVAGSGFSRASEITNTGGASGTSSFVQWKDVTAPLSSATLAAGGAYTEQFWAVATFAFTSDASASSVWASFEAPDIFAAIGAANLAGTWASTEAKDIFAATGGIPDTGVWTDVEAPDHFSAYAVTPPIGTWASTESPDTWGDARQERFEVESVFDLGVGSPIPYTTNGRDRIICLIVGAYANGSASDHVTSIDDSAGHEWQLQDYYDIGRDEQGQQHHLEMWWAYARDQVTSATCRVNMGGGFSFVHCLSAMVFIKGMGGNFNNPFSDANPYSFGNNLGAFGTPPDTQIRAPRPVATGPLSASGQVSNPASFDPTNLHGVTLGGSNLHVTSVGSGGPHNYATIPLALAKIQGQIYIEAQFVNIAGSHYGAGFAWASDSAQQFNTAIDDGTGGFIVRGDGSIWSGGVNIGNVGCTPANGDIIGIAIDIEHNSIWARDVTQNTHFNNNASAFPQYSSSHFIAGGVVGTSSYIAGEPPLNVSAGTHIGLGGYLLPFAAPDGTSASSEIDVNFGATSFVGTPPPGYQAGWGTPAPAVTPTRTEQHAIVLGWDATVPDDLIKEAPPGFVLNYVHNADPSAGFRLSIYSKIIAENILTTDNELMIHPTPTKHWIMMYDTIVAGHVSPGTLESTEARDTMRAVGYGPGGAGQFGFLAATEATDAMHFIGLGPVSGRLFTAEAPDVFSAFISVPITLTFNATEARDIFAGTGIGLGEDGVWFSTEALDTLTINGVVPIAGTFDTSETADRFLAIGSGVVTSRRRRRRNFVT